MSRKREAIARAIVAKRETGGFRGTRELADLIQEAAPVRIEKPGPGVATPRQQRLRPVARVFQVLRILVNRELANLTALLRVLPTLLSPGGRACVISFHSGEDRLVKQAFRDGLRSGLYVETSGEAVRAGFIERQTNPRARSAKMRWAREKRLAATRRLCGGERDTCDRACSLRRPRVAAKPTLPHQNRNHHRHRNCGNGIVPIVVLPAAGDLAQVSLHEP